MNRTEQIIRNVEKHRQRIFDAHAYIWAHPETGYREWKTSAYLENAFEQLGYSLVKAGNIPGFYTDLDTGRPGPKVLIMGELDSLICDGHPEAGSRHPLCTRLRPQCPGRRPSGHCRRPAGARSAGWTVWKHTPVGCAGGGAH